MNIVWKFLMLSLCISLIGHALVAFQLLIVLVLIIALITDPQAVIGWLLIMLALSFVQHHPLLSMGCVILSLLVVAIREL